jgi:hypothetical protein
MNQVRLCTNHVRDGNVERQASLVDPFVCSCYHPGFVLRVSANFHHLGTVHSSALEKVMVPNSRII